MHYSLVARHASNVEKLQTTRCKSDVAVFDVPIPNVFDATGPSHLLSLKKVRMNETKVLKYFKVLHYIVFQNKNK